VPAAFQALTRGKIYEYHGLHSRHPVIDAGDDAMHWFDFFMWLWIASFVLIPLMFWCAQVLDLMSRPDSDFPGRNDKVLWALFLLFANFIGAVLYWYWKRLVIESVDRDRRLAEMKANSLRELGRGGASPDAPLA
jgi:hypothetical protein